MIKDILKKYPDFFETYAVSRGPATELYNDLAKEYAKNDDAHNISHLDDVLMAGYHILKRIGDGLETIDRISTYTAILFHDSRAHVNRELHHDLSADYFISRLTTTHKLEKDESGWSARISKKGRALVQLRFDEKKVEEAIRQHRASFKGKYYSIVSELVAGADRGIPVVSEEVVWKEIRRSYKYHVGKLDEPHDVAAREALKHVKEKYGSDGYAKYPPIIEKLYKGELRAYRKLIDDICTREDSINRL